MPKIVALLAALATMAATAASAAPVDWRNVGLRVAYRQVITPVGPRTLPYVLAVQERSPAYFAGVLPGDAVSFLYCGSWNLNFIDRQRDGSSFFQTYESVGAQDVTVADPAGAQCRAGVDGIISILKPPGDARPWRDMVGFRTGAGDGQWLNNATAIAGGRDAARTSIAGNLDQLRAETFKQVQASPCGYSPSSAYDTARLHPAVRALSEQSSRLGGGENMPYWLQVQRAYCSISRDGPLPSFESALFLMHQGRLKPCAYDPKINYAAIPPDYSTQTLPRSKMEYEAETRFSSLLTGMFDARETACLTRLMRQQLSSAAPN